MNQATSQKQREREFLEKFRSCYGDFPIGEITNSESPDFIVKNGESCTGIEVTEFYSQLRDDEPPPAQARESRRAKVLRYVEEECKANGLSDFQVSVDFHPGKELAPKRESDFVQELAQLIQRNLPGPGGKISLSQTPKNPDRPPDEIIRVWIAQPSNSDELSYVVSSVGGISPKHTLSELQEEINHKEERVSTYKQWCPEVWLLIVGGQSRRPSTWIDLPEEINEHKFHSAFDKVFFLHDYRSEVKEFLLDDQNRTAQDAP